MFFFYNPLYTPNDQGFFIAQLDPIWVGCQTAGATIYDGDLLDALSKILTLPRKNNQLIEMHQCTCEMKDILI